MDELLKDFLVETGEHIEAVTTQLVRFERDPGDTRIIGNIYRLVHSIKGTCGFLDLPRLEAIAHAAETLIGRLRDGAPPTQEAVTLVLRAVDRIKQIVAGIEASAAEPQGDDSALIAELVSRASGVRLRQPDNEVWDGPEPDPLAEQTAPPVVNLPERRTETVRVSVGTLERLMALVSELVLARNQIVDRARLFAGEAMEQPIQRLSSVTTDLQHGVMKARMQPVGRLFASLPRVVRDLAAELGKKIDVSTSGGDTELDRQLIALVRDPLTHMIRNACGHGIETPEQRRAAGKNETGHISVRAYHDAGHIVIDVSDDGRGIDVEAIRVKAVAKGLAREAEVACLSDADVCRYIFAPGFSTAKAVTSLSGRGIGMDVVRENIEAIGGSVGLNTAPGVGTTFMLKIPITLAIAPALIVASAGDRFAMPQDGVVEVYEIGEGGTRVETIQGAQVAVCSRGVFAAGDLRDILRIGAPGEAREPATHIVVLRIGGSLFGVLVEQILEVIDIVVKPLPAKLARIGMFSGNTILGDGSIMLILDAAGLARALGVAKVETFRVASAPQAASDPNAPIVLFRIGEGAVKALPISLVARIDSVRRDDIETVDGGPLARLAGALTPLILDPRQGWPEVVPGRPKPFKPVLVIGEGREVAGLVVDEIIDIVDDTLDVSIGGRREGVLGSASLRGEAVEVPDVAWLMERARPAATRRSGAGAPILIADPSPFFRDLLRAILTAAGFETATTETVAAANDMLERGAFAALLLDAQMPEAGALVSRLRDTERFAALPILALAPHATQAARRRGAELGADRVIGKFDRAGLVEAVAALAPDRREEIAA
jgi:two-component system chemotaxis sensor kinase CheA